MKYLILILLLSFFSRAQSASFTSGVNFTGFRVRGKLSVSCRARTSAPISRSTICDFNILNSNEKEYFIGNTSGATMLKIQAKRENSTLSEVQMVSYDGEKGVSKQPINLWLRSLIQRPLLGIGKNTVHFILTQKSKIIEDQNFDVIVKEGGEKTCTEIGFYSSLLSSDCDSPQNLCERYFSENNYCL